MVYTLFKAVLEYCKNNLKKEAILLQIYDSESLQKIYFLR